MANFLGINYQRDPMQAKLWNEFQSTLTPAQTQARTAAQASLKTFESELTPDQKAAQQKFQLEKLEGAPKSIWQADQKAFVGTLNSQELADRSSEGALHKTFMGTLSPEQKDLRGSAVGLRNATVLKQLDINA